MRFPVPNAFDVLAEILNELNAWHGRRAAKLRADRPNEVHGILEVHPDSVGGILKPPSAGRFRSGFVRQPLLTRRLCHQSGT
jgi:hypothetical protein